MKETTALNRISKIVDSIDYKFVYIEIQTKNDKYTLQKDKDFVVNGFKQTEVKRCQGIKTVGEK